MPNIVDTVIATENRLKELYSQLDKVADQYEKGKISAEQYAASTKKIEDEVDSLNGTIKEQEQTIGEYNGSWEKVGATANTSLGLISVAIKDTNPGLSTMIGSVQKMIPNLVELGNAASKTGSFIKAMTSSAGILTLITLITTLITDFDNIAETIGVSTTKIEEFKSKAGDAIQKVSGWIGGLGNMLVQSVLAPVKGAIEAFRILKEQGLKGAKEAAKALGEGLYNGSIFNASNNFKQGQSTVDNWVEGVRSRKKNVASAGKETGDSFYDALKKSVDSALTENERKFNERLSLLSSQAREILADIVEETKSLTDNIDEFSSSVVDGIIQEALAPIEAAKKAQEEADKLKEAEQTMHDQRMEHVSAYLSAASNMFTKVGDMISDNLDAELESGKITEKEYDRKKKAMQAFQIAAIIADLASGVQSIWTAFAKEKISNAETAAATGPAAAVTLTALNTKSLVSAIAQSSSLGLTAAAGIASIRSNSKSATTSVSAPSVSTPAPAATQTYTLNQDYTDNLSDITNAISAQKVVLVLDDLSKVQEDMNRVKVNSSF